MGLWTEPELFCEERQSCSFPLGLVVVHAKEVLPAPDSGRTDGDGGVEADWLNFQCGRGCSFDPPHAVVSAPCDARAEASDHG